MTSATSTTQDIPSTLAGMSAASLFVGDLLPHVNELILYKKFAPMGTVTSVKLCRDWVTGNSLCYAYVNFENPAEAEKAYRSLNYELLEGQPMRIMKSTRSPWVPKAGDCSCFHHHHHCCAGVGVGASLTANKGLVDAKTLMEAIESYSMAFKTLANQDSGEAKSPTGYKYSSEFLKRMNTTNNRFTNVFIRNFKDLLDDFKLWKLCKQFGEVTSAKVMVDEYGISKGFGFACFTDCDSAQRAVNKLNGLVLDGRILYAGPAMTRTQRQRDYGPRRRYDADMQRQEWRSPHTSSSNTSHGTGGSGANITGLSSLASCSPRICVRNLRDLVDDVRLRKEFERFGPVLHAELLKNFDNTSKGIGYVIYKDQTDATKALNSMHGKVIYGTRISVTYAPYTATAATNTIPDYANSSSGSNNMPITTPPRSGRRDNGNNTTVVTTDDAGNNSCSISNSNSVSNNNSKSCASNNKNQATLTCADMKCSGGGDGIGDSTEMSTRNDGDNNSNSKNLLQLKDLVSTLANKGHPVNINDISSFTSSSVNRNSSNNSDNINTSNNAILALTAARKAATVDVASGKRSTSAQTTSTSTSNATTITATANTATNDDTCNSNNGSASGSGNNNDSGNKRKSMRRGGKTNNNDNEDYGNSSNGCDYEKEEAKEEEEEEEEEERYVNYDDEDDANDDDYSDECEAATRGGCHGSISSRNRRRLRGVASDYDLDDTTSTTATLSVKNLDESITDEKLESLFSVYGPVVSAKVISNEFGASKGFGFVIMAEAQDAVRAIKNLDGRIVVNRPVYVAPTGQPRSLTRA